MPWLKRRERRLLRTHEAPFKDAEHGVGRLVQHEGRLYRVTRWEELRPLPLERGGSLREWQVWGRPLSKDEMRDEVLGATERILEQDQEGGSGADG